jgi:peroxiredoxin
VARTESTMLELETRAPDFTLTDPRTGKTHSRKDFVNRSLLVMFICNHCPFVVHVRDKLREVARAFEERGIAVVAINSNDPGTHPADSPEKMKLENYSFPYLFDESQSVARDFHAACTPDFFLFDRHHRLVYRGQLDDSRPGNSKPVTGHDLVAAAELLLAGASVPAEQKPSMGCNIKWKQGNEPAYFSA